MLEQEGDNLKDCCICGEGGVRRAVGFWWCEEHYDCVELKNFGESFESERGKSCRNGRGLGLEWL
ncbi:hypothetical protein AKJ49_00465 [candidate division MSBL1 archaeon SCGC-AAA382A03]|uniref:Uncharacterized protein n=1 Tax=candidate division MSBL1 archaeon SCGC-AAA382A03 TaxID=1698278 RepID=A0A133VGM0_9EURY|nr:hypothetical protein AKJ49_00465 [candidate division MSBL1 archaeon SCGC-AAA382A03]